MAQPDPPPALRARRKGPSSPPRGASLGRIAGAVCFDADFPDLIARTGRERAGLLIIPASDWRAIDPVHTRMALVRGIENGCPVVRQTNRGLSAAADPQGRILAASDYFRADPRTMVAQVPARGVRTLYPLVPHALPVLCIAGLMLGAVRALTGRGAAGSRPPPRAHPADRAT